MGLDIAFSRKKAVEAGIQFKTVRNGSVEAIDRAMNCEYPDPDFVA